MTDSTATNELLQWELQQRKDKATASRANLLLVRNFFFVLAVLVLTITIATLLAGPARQALLR